MQYDRFNAAVQGRGFQQGCGKSNQARRLQIFRDISDQEFPIFLVRTMENGRHLWASGPSTVVKRHISIDTDDTDRDCKKICTVNLSGIKTSSGASNVLPSWRDGNGGRWSRFDDTLGQGDLEVRPTLPGLSQLFPLRGDDWRTYPLDITSDAGNFVPAPKYECKSYLESPFLPILDQTESEMNGIQFSSVTGTDNSNNDQLARPIWPQEEAWPPVEMQYVDGVSNMITTESGWGDQSQSPEGVGSDNGPKIFDTECIHRGPTTAQYDSCFGVIVATATSALTGNKGTKLAPVNIKAFGDVFMLSFQDSNKYAGLISLPVLKKLLEEFTVELAATLIAPQSGQSQASKKDKVCKLESTEDCSVRIIVYGVQCEKVALAKVLSDAGVYLQHPSATECDTGVTYCNPQYLLRPGSQMPKLEELLLSLDVQGSTMSDSLDEMSKSQLMRIFDSASEIGTSWKADPSPRLLSTLKDHQLTALAMMVEKECGILEGTKFPSIWERSNNSQIEKRYRHKITGNSESMPIPVCGGIIADDMGLGKTLSLLALVCWSLDKMDKHRSPGNYGVSRATLIVTPKSTIPGWQQQIERHIHPGKIRAVVYHGSTRRRNASKLLRDNDIVLTTYETLRYEWITNGALYTENWRRLVLDEAHHIRNRSSQTFKAACSVVAQYHWCLTGTPIQNSLDDYGALLTFVGVPPFRDKSMFDFWIVNPIKEERPHSLRRLRDLVSSTCLRRTKAMTMKSVELPSRVENIESVQLHQVDRELYDFFKLKASNIAAHLSKPEAASPRSDTEENNILSLINLLRLICNHGEQLLPTTALQAWNSRDNGMLDWQMMKACGKRCDACGTDIEESDLPSSNTIEFRCRHSICGTCVIDNRDGGTNEEWTCPKYPKPTKANAALRSTVSNFSDMFVPPSAKIEALLRNLREEQAGNLNNPAIPIKSVIFSYWTRMLDLIQQAIKKEIFGFQRIDGQTSLPDRRKAISQFKEDRKSTIMLASIGSAGEGVDLTAASNVHLIEPHWNPMAEAQAVDRVHRIGQTRDVIITRYVTRNSIETYVQWIQQDKMKVISQSLESTGTSQSDIDDGRWKDFPENLPVIVNVKSKLREEPPECFGIPALYTFFG